MTDKTTQPGLGYTVGQLQELSQALTEQLDICSARLVDLIHRETGKRIEPRAIEQMRNVVAWAIALSCVTTVEHRERKKKAQP